MQLIKRVGAFLVHSAYISSNNLIYTKTKPPHFGRVNPDTDAFVSDIYDNIVETSSNPLNTLDIIDNTVNSVNNAFDNSNSTSFDNTINKTFDMGDIAPNTLDFCDITANTLDTSDITVDSFEYKDRSNAVDTIANSLSPAHYPLDAPDDSETKNEYMDSFDQRYSRSEPFGTKKLNMMSESRGIEATPDDSVVIGSQEYNNLKEEIAMLKRELYKTKSYIEKPKVKKKVYNTIEVRVSLRIQEADLRTKCNFFRKKALKGYPLVLTIRTEGDPKDYTLAAEGIIAKAKKLLSNACVPAGKMFVTNTHISQHFKPLKKPSYSSEKPFSKERDSFGESSSFRDTHDTYSKSHSYSERENSKTPSYELDSGPSRLETHSRPTKPVYRPEITNTDELTVGYTRKSGLYDTFVDNTRKRLPETSVNHFRERSSEKSFGSPVVTVRSASSGETHSRWIVKHKSSTNEPLNDMNSRDELNTGAEDSKWKVLNKPR